MPIQAIEGVVMVCNGELIRGASGSEMPNARAAGQGPGAYLRYGTATYLRV